MTINDEMPFGKFKGTKLKDLDPPYIANLLSLGSLSDDFTEPLKEVLIFKLKINPFSSDIIRKLIENKFDSISIDRKVGLINQITLTKTEIDYILLQFEAIVNSNFDRL